MPTGNNNIPTGLYWQGKRTEGMNTEEGQDFGFQPVELDIRRQKVI